MKHKIKMFYYRFTSKCTELWHAIKNKYLCFKDSPYFSLVSLISIVLLIGIISGIIAILPAKEANESETTIDVYEPDSTIMALAEPESTTFIPETTQAETSTEEETSTSPAIIPMDQLSIETVAPSEQGNGHNSNTISDGSNGYEPTPSNGSFCQSGYTSIIHGIDVSHWQGNINWSMVKSAGYQFAFVKVCGRGTRGGGLYTDDKYIENIRGALNAGMNVGAYVFSQAITVNEAIEEASLIVNCLKSNNLQINYPVVFDWETGSNYRSNGAKLSNAQMTKIVNAFISTVENAGYEVMVYGNAYDLSLFDINSVAKNHSVWYARYWSYYRNYDNYFQSGKQTPTTTFPYQIWQYKDTGTVPGISEKVDINVAFVHSSIKLEAKNSTITVAKDSLFNPLNEVSATDDNGRDYSSSISYVITDNTKKSIFLKDAISNAGTYTITYNVVDQYSYEIKTTCTLIVREKPSLTIATNSIIYFDRTDSSLIDSSLLSNELCELILNNVTTAADEEGHSLIDKLTIIYQPTLFISDESGNILTDISALTNSLLVHGNYTIKYSVTDNYGITNHDELSLKIFSLNSTELEFDITTANGENFESIIKENLLNNIIPGADDNLVITYDPALINALKNKVFESSNEYMVTYTIIGLDSNKYYRTCYIKIVP